MNTITASAAQETMIEMQLELEPSEVQHLRDYAARHEHTFGHEELVLGAKLTFGIGGNTYRTMKKGVKQIFDGWAREHTTALRDAPGTFSEKIQTRTAFLEWHRTTERKLRGRIQEYDPDVAYAYPLKLIDLHVKWLTRFELGASGLTELLVRHGNCALDKFTLASMNKAVGGALPIRNPSMGDIESRASYDFCQGVIGAIAARAGTSRLMADMFWWPTKPKAETGEMR